MTAEIKQDVRARNLELARDLGRHQDGGLRAPSGGEDMVLILGRLCIVGRESGVPLENEYAMLYRAEGGLLKAGWSFLSHEDAEAKARELEAASQDA